MTAVEPGFALPPLTVPIRRVDLIRYAGASGDFNPIHWNARVATAVGLPDVIAHGMLTMAQAIRIVTDWLGDPAAVLDYQVRFTRPVVVPDDDEGATLEVTATVTEVREDGTGVVSITARSTGAAVLGRATATVRLP